MVMRFMPWQYPTFRYVLMNTIYVKFFVHARPLLQKTHLCICVYQINWVDGLCVCFCFVGNNTLEMPGVSRLVCAEVLAPNLWTDNYLGMLRRRRVLELLSECAVVT